MILFVISGFSRRLLMNVTNMGRRCIAAVRLQISHSFRSLTPALTHVDAHTDPLRDSQEPPIMSSGFDFNAVEIEPTLFGMGMLDATLQPFAVIVRTACGSPLRGTGHT